MAVVVKNTFLDVPSHKFLCIEESFCCSRRCQSVPRTWKPEAPPKKSTFRKRSPSLSSRCSVHSDISLCSTVDTLKNGDDSAASESEIGSPTARSSSEYDLTNVAVPESLGQGNHIKTKLKAEAPAFKPVTATPDTRFDAVTYAVYLALLSSGHANKVNIDKGVQGCSPSMITAQLPSGSSSIARCYEAVHLARNALEEVTGALGSVVLLSKRVQKEDTGYSLRSSVACIPCGMQDYMCWDLFKTGSCPRRGKCQWYHPQESDIGRVKVCIRCTEETKPQAASSEDQLPAGSPAVRHKISLGDLVQ